MNPFAAQRRAFELTRAGSFKDAVATFAEAVSGFERLICEEQRRALVADRARLIWGYEERATEIADQFLQSLPEWLRELHFDCFYQALVDNTVDPEVARTHWKLLVMAAKRPAFATAINLDLLREQACQRNQITRDDLTESVSKRAGVLSRAERMLTVDAGNRAAWRAAVHGYTDEIHTTLERLAAARNPNEPLSTLDRLTAGKRQRLQVRLRKTVRRLRLHLRRGLSRAEVDVDEMVFSYRQLCHYYIGVGEMETAIRLSRRARRLRPADAELLRWVRRVRQLRRRQ